VTFDNRELALLIWLVVLVVLGLATIVCAEWVIDVGTVAERLSLSTGSPPRFGGVPKV